MRALALLLLLPALALAQEQAAPPAQPAPPPAKKAPRDQVYKWVDKDGVIHYSSTPPTDNATPAKLPPLQTYKGGTNPDLTRLAKPTASGAPVLSTVQIVTPSQDETFRGGDPVVPVAVQVTPQMAQDMKLIYLLDGLPVAPPIADTSYALTGLDRGTHTVSVTLIDGSGQEVGTSQSVTFHLKQPTVDKAAKPAKPPAKPVTPKPKPP